MQNPRIARGRFPHESGRVPAQILVDSHYISPRYYRSHPLGPVMRLYDGGENLSEIALQWELNNEFHRTVFDCFS